MMPTTAELIAHAATLGETVSVRSLEEWRSGRLGLLPGAVRRAAPGQPAVWVHPEGTIEQMAAVLRLRKTTKRPEDLRALLWFEGFPTEARLTQATLVTALQAIIEEFETLVAVGPDGNSPIAPTEAVAMFAKEYARKRGPGVPRFGRQKLAERTAAFNLVFRLAFGVPPDAETLSSDAEAFERASGLERGRTDQIGGISWLTGDPAEIAGAASIMNIYRLREELTTSTFADLEMARRLSRTLLTSLQVTSVLVDATSGTPNTAGLGAIQQVEVDDAAGVAFHVGLALAMARSELAQGAIELLIPMNQILDVASNLGTLTNLEPGDLDLRLARMEPKERLLAERLLSAALPSIEHVRR